MAKKSRSGTRRDAQGLARGAAARVAAANAKRVPLRPNNPVDLYAHLTFQVAALELERTELKDKLVGDLGAGTHEGSKFAIQIQLYDQTSKDDVFKKRVTDLILKYTRPRWRIWHTRKTPCSRIYVKSKDGDWI